MRHALFTLLKRDLLLAFRQPSELINPLIFFLIVVSLFPMGLKPETPFLPMMGAAVIWVAALLASMLSLDSMFRADMEDGSLEQILLSPWPLPLLALTKILAHWLISGIPLVVMAPLLGLMFNLPAEGISALVVTLLLGTPVLSLIGAIGVALTVSLRRGGVLLSLLVLPLYIPVLIFGAGSVWDASLGLSIRGPVLFMGAILVLALTLAPLAVAGALRISLE
ncbi:MAG: heme exporter protein CcmB [Gammaproteobacteria bacterium]|nr:heme exporter protein CcmB [Gammaproteobacteria bacterium]